MTTQKINYADLLKRGIEKSKHCNIIDNTSIQVSLVTRDDASIDVTLTQITTDDDEPESPNQVMSETYIDTESDLTDNDEFESQPQLTNIPEKSRIMQTRKGEHVQICSSCKDCCNGVTSAAVVLLDVKKKQIILVQDIKGFYNECGGGINRTELKMHLDRKSSMNSVNYITSLTASRELKEEVRGIISNTYDDEHNKICQLVITSNHLLNNCNYVDILRWDDDNHIHRSYLCKINGLNCGKFFQLKKRGKKNTLPKDQREMAAIRRFDIDQLKKNYKENNGRLTNKQSGVDYKKEQIIRNNKKEFVVKKINKEYELYDRICSVLEGMIRQNMF